MTKTTKTTKTTKYIHKLIVNGQVITQHSKQIITTIKGTEVTLNCCYVSELELKDAYTSSFNIKHHDKNIEIYYVKVNNRVSATLYINEVLAFSSMSMQAIFTILNVAYGISKSSINNLYVKSNTLRKQATRNVSKVVVENSFDF